MQIRETYDSLEKYEERKVYRMSREGEFIRDSVSILTEHLINVYINEHLVMKLICTPHNLAELVLGRMFSEGMIRNISEVDYIYICEYGSRARVALNRSQKKQTEALYVETTPTCCTGNRILSDYFVDYQDVKPVTPIPWTTAWIWTLIDWFDKDTPLHLQTSAVHSSFLMKDGQVIFQCEDIGRHNALDKTIGYALRNGIDLKQCVVFNTGRMPTDLVTKVIRAGIPILVTKETPTRETLELAREYHLTVVGQAKKRQMVLYEGKPAQDMVAVK